MNISIIGTRRITEKQYKYLYSVANRLAHKGHTLITGCAPGADEACVKATNAVNPKQLTLLLPWATFNKEWHHAQNIKITSQPQNWVESVKQYHPAPDKLKPSHVKLMARNYGIVEHSDVIIALPNADRTGGTEQGIRIALDLGKPLFLLVDKDSCIKLEEFIAKS